MKQTLCCLISAIFIVMALAAPLASAEGGNENAAFREWETDIRLSIEEEYQLIEEAGMDLASWDAMLEEMKQAGLADPVSAEALRQADENALILEENGLVYQLGPSSLFGTVADMPEAYRLAYRLIGTLGGSELTRLYLKSRLTMNDKTVYSFQQVCDGVEILGGTLKIALNGENEVTAVFSCIDPEGSREQTLVSQKEAEALAASRCGENGQPSEVLSEYTERVFLMLGDKPALLNLDVDADPVPESLVWIVYTSNEGEEKETRPFLAHYVQVDGEYLKSLPVRQPGDTEARCGFRQAEIFAGMTADTYTGEITDVNGNTRTVTVPVMRSEADGCWYLGDVDRRIFFADYFEAAYGEDHPLILVKSEDNLDWDKEDIYFLYNYLRAYDFYADMGWIGPDGKDSDVVIFRGMKYSNGMVYDNACSLGKVECWQGFSYSPYAENGTPLGLSWALDILAHEYTHTFTGTVMNQNLYENDLGAINEAMSDIFGNLIEYICGDTEDTSWIIGENSGYPLRNMADPQSFGQPTSVWGLYYVPSVDQPNTVNDRGGVHSNSSLLNLIGAALCTEYGMSYEDAVSFWLMTAMGLTPRADYVQISNLLPWALEQSGLSDAYGEALEELIDRTRICSVDLPETLPEGQKLIRLVLPDTEAFQNEDWVLFITQSERKTAEEVTDSLYELLTQVLENPDRRKSFSEDLKRLAEMLDQMDQEPDDAAEAENPDEAEPYNPAGDIATEAAAQLLNLVQKSERSLFTWEEQDTRIMTMVIPDKPASYTLINISNGGSQLNMVVLLEDGRWVDNTDIYLGNISDEENLDLALKSYREYLDKLNTIFTKPVETDASEEDSMFRSFMIQYLPSDGLEGIVLEVEAETGDEAA